MFAYQDDVGDSEPFYRWKWQKKNTPQYSAKSYLDQKWALGETIHKFFCHFSHLRQAKLSSEISTQVSLA